MQLTTEQHKQILIVEDEGIIAADIQSRLERLGYKVPAIARTGEEALHFARSTPFDLVLMDIRLKGDMDGIATAQTMKTELETPVVYITAHADEETIDRATRTEPFGYILKPIRDSELRSAVRISIQKHEMELRLRTSEAWLATTLRSIGEGVIPTNTDGDGGFMNRVVKQLTGWSRLALLHPQESRLRNRAGLIHGAQHRRPERRPHHGPQRGGPGHGIRDPAAAIGRLSDLARY